MASKTVTADSPSSVMDMIPTAEGQQFHGEPETIKVSDLTGGGEPITLELDQKEETPAKDVKEVATPEVDDDDDDDDAAGSPEPDESLAIAQALLEQFASDPAEAMKSLWDAAPADAQSKFINDLSNKSKAQSNEVDFEAQSEFETGLLPVFNDLKAIPEFKNTVQTAFGQHADFINDAHIQVNVLGAMVQALADLSGVKFPEADLDGMLKAVKSGKSYADATKAFKAQLTKAAGRVKQANTDRPAGTKTEAAGHLVVDPKDDLATAIRKYKDSH